MPSKTLWFNRTLFVKNLTRFWPIWTGYGLFWVLALPAQLLNRHLRGFGDPAAFADQDVLSSVSGLVITALIAAIGAAMAVFSYLYNNRSTGMVHALPLRREGLFFTNYLSGLTFLAGPAVVVFLLTLGAEAVTGYVNAGALCMWLTVHLLVILFFYSLAVFCAMCTGNLVALPAFYGIINALVIVLFVVIHEMLSTFLYGFDRVDWMENAALWSTPVARLMEDLWLERFYDDVGNLLSTSFHGLFTALVYGLVGVGLTVGALFLYRKRHLETAGDVISVPWIKPVFKYGLALTSALVVGSVLFSIFGGTRYDGVSLWAGLVWFLPCCAVGYFAGEMLLQKSFRVFRRSVKGCLAVLAVVVVGVGVVHFDPFGFTRWLPDPGKVTGVTVSSVNTYPSDDGNYSNYDIADPEEIARVVALHQSVLGQKPVWERGFDHADWNGGSAWLSDGREYSYSATETASLRLEYKMADGGSAYRYYRLLLTEEQLADPASHTAQLTDFLNRPGRWEESYHFPTSEQVRLVAADLPVFNRSTWEETNATIPVEGLPALYAAIRSDMAAGRLGVRYLLENKERLENCYYNDLVLGFYDPSGADTETKMYADKYGEYTRPAERESNWTMRITLQASATDTLAVLRRLGVIDEDHRLSTQAEFQFWRDTRSG